MNERDLIATQTIKQVSEGGDKVRADLKATASAQDQLAASSANLATATESSARRQTSAAAAFTALQMKVDPASRAMADLERAQRTVARALDQGVASQSKANDVLGTYVTRVNAAAAAANTAAIAEENRRRAQANASVNQGQGFNPSSANTGSYAAMFGGLLDIAEGKARQAGQAFGAALDASLIAGVAKSARDSAAVFSAEMDRVDDIARHKAQQIGKNFQDGLNQSFGIGGSSKSARDSAAVFEEAARGQDAMAAAAARLKAALNPLAVEEAKQVQELALLKQAYHAGMITQEQFAAAQPLLAKRLSDVAQSMRAAGTTGRVMSGELVNMGYQLNDVVTGLALGQSPFMILAQQGGQVVQILQNSKASVGEFVGAAARGFASLITPVTATVAGIVALGAAAAAAALQMDRLQVSSQRAMIGAGARTGTTVADLNTFTQQNSSSLTSPGIGLSNKEARSLGEEFTKTGEIVISRLKGMSDAVVGFANQTGMSMDEASKALVGFAVDPKKALDELSKTYGGFDVATRKAVDALVMAGDKTGAFQVIIDSLGEKSKKAAENMGIFEKAARGIGNVLASETVNPSGLEEQLAAAQKKLSSAVPASDGNQFATANIESLRKTVEDLQSALDKVNAQKAAAELAHLSTRADGVVNSIIPQIAQIKALETSLAELERAKSAGATSKEGTAVDNAAATAIQNQIAALRELQAEAVRYNQRIQEIGAAWGGVGQSTALSLQAAQNQLPVLEAVGGAAKMAAQYAADYTNAIDRGKTATEAAALASSGFAAAYAQVNAQAKEALFQLQNQAAAASAVTGAAQMTAQAEATKNQLIRDGVDAYTAQAVAAKQIANAVAQANASVQRQVEALEDSTRLIKAQGTSQEGAVKATIAYENAMKSGADATEASALHAATLENHMAQAAQSTDNAAAAALEWQQNLFGVGAAAQQAAASIEAAADAEERASRAARSHSQFAADPSKTIKTTANGNGVSPLPLEFMAGIQLLLAGSEGAPTWLPDNLGLEGLQPLVDANNQKWIDQRAREASELKNSLDKLTTSTDRLNATNGELLSPYYTQDPRTSHIGFRSQGMASGGWVDVPGAPSANDNMIAQIPVAGGERIYVDPNPSKRGGAGGGTPAINIHMGGITIQGNVSRDEIGRTMYQVSQAMAKQLQAARQ